MTPIPPNKALQDLTNAITELYVHLDDSAFNRYLKDVKSLSDDLADLIGLDIVKEGKKLLAGLTDAMQKVEKTQIRSLATNKNLISTINTDQIQSSLQLGVAIDKLSEDVINLREAGVLNLNSSTIRLAARMRATGQSTESLVKFLKSNTSVMMLNQKESQNLAYDLAKFSNIYNSRQDDILELTTSLSKNFQIQSQLAGAGQGGNIQAAFASFATTLGNRVDPLVDQMASIFGKGDLGQLIQLGIADGFQESLMAESDPTRQAELVKQMVLTASQAIEQRTSGLGTGAVDRQIYKQLIQSMGGENILVFRQLAKALEDQKSADSPWFTLDSAITTFGGIIESFLMPIKVFGGILLNFINLPGISHVIKWTAYLAGFGVSLMMAAKTFALATSLFSRSILIGAGKFLLSSAQMLLASLPFQAITAPLLIIAAVAGAAYGLWQLMGSNIEEINRKTPDQRSINAGLTGQIFSQLVNIVTSTNSNSIQRESLQTQRELVRLIRQQNDRTDPNNSLATKPFTRRI